MNPPAVAPPEEHPMAQTVPNPALSGEQTDAELETILTSFDSNYVWNYGSVKEGLRDLYEKAKREQWNATSQLDWSIEVDPETKPQLHGWLPFLIFPVAAAGWQTPQ
jgi:hypothetical protein